MKKQEKTWGITDVMIALSIFVISTISLFLRIFYTQASPLLIKVLNYIGIIGLFIVAEMILIYWASTIFTWLKEDRKRIILTLAIIFVMGYSVVGGLYNKSWLKFFENFFYSGLVIIAIYVADLISNKIKQPKKP